MERRKGLLELQNSNRKAMTALWGDDISFLKGEWKGLAVGQAPEEVFLMTSPQRKTLSALSCR